MTARPGRPRPVVVGAAATALLAATAAACSSVTPAGTDAGGAASATASYGEPVSADQVQQGGRLVMALSADPDKLDPTLSRSLYSRYVFHAMCEKLYDVDQSSTIVPQLATALPTTSPDGLTVTIPVRSDAKFSDGTPMDAAAVKATFDRNLTLPGSGRKSELGPVTGVTAPDPTTVVVTLSQPFAPLTAALADRAGMVLNPATTAALGADFATAPSCVGPFKLADRVPQNSIDLVKDPNYYDAAKVHLDSISYRIITDANIRAANLRSGDVQVADSVSAQDVDQLRADPSLTVLQSTSLGYQGVTFNVGNANGVGNPVGPVPYPTGQDPRVRQAFELAVDREALVKVVFNGLNSPACSPIAPSTELSSDAAQACPPHDPAKAKQLLADAGVTTPVPVSMITSNNPDSLRLAQALQAMVKDGGFDLTIQPVEYASLLDQQDRGDFQALQLGWSGRVDPDANTTNFVGTGGSQNVAGYSSPQMDALLTQARQSQDPAERARLYGQVTDLLHTDDPIVYLYRQSNLTGVGPTAKGVQVFPDGVIRVAFAGLAK
ncbi:ABC transporter substrate-binding protein [Rhodococcus aerolatus]